MKQATLDWIARRATVPFGETVPELLEGGYPPCDMFVRRDVGDLVMNHDIRRGEFNPGYKKLAVIRGQRELRFDEYDTDRDVERLFDDGATIMCRLLHSYMKDLREVCQQVADATGIPATASAYLTPPNSQGFPLHGDSDSVFAVQVHGSKTWLFFNPKTADPYDIDNISWVQEDGRTEEVAPRNKAAYELTVKAGDVLFVPRGWSHYALTDGEESLHVSLGVLHEEMDPARVAKQLPVIPA